MVDGIDGNEHFLAGGYGIVGAAAGEGVDGVDGGGVGHDVGRVVLLVGGKERRFGQGIAVEIERLVAVVADFDVLVVAVLLALGRRGAGEEDFADDEAFRTDGEVEVLGFDDGLESVVVVLVLKTCLHELGHVEGDVGKVERVLLQFGRLGHIGGQEVVASLEGFLIDVLDGGGNADVADALRAEEGFRADGCHVVGFAAVGHLGGQGDVAGVGVVVGGGVGHFDGFLAGDVVEDVAAPEVESVGSSARCHSRDGTEGQTGKDVVHKVWSLN